MSSLGQIRGGYITNNEICTHNFSAKADEGLPGAVADRVPGTVLGLFICWTDECLLGTSSLCLG